MAPPVSLGVTALLDELLSEEAKLERAMDAFTGRDAQNPSSGGQEVAEAEQEEPQLSPEDQRQLAELHQEVDGCLASMEDWKEESRLRRLKLEKELEAEFGFSCHLESQSYSVGDEPQEDAKDGHSSLHEEKEEEEDISRYLGGRHNRHRENREPLAPLLDTQAHVSATSSVKAGIRDEARRADVDRIEKLRSEVEAMRQQESMGPYDGMGSEALDDTMPAGMAGLSAWCEEVDAVLENPSFGADMGEFKRAREGLNEMDSGLVEAQSRVNADILEMEKLLAECGAAIQARKSSMEN